MKHPRLAALGLLFSALALLVGCGDSDSDSSDDDSVGSESAPVEDDGDTTADENVEDGEGDEASGTNPAVPEATYVAVFDDGPAGTIDGTDVAAAAVFEEAEQQAAAQEAEGQTSSARDPDGDGFAATLIGEILSQQLVDVLVEAELSERNLEVTEAARESALETLGEIPDGVSEEFVDRIIDRRAAFEALGDDLVAQAGPGAEFPCSRHVLVETEEEAQAIIARLEGGDEFAEVAAEESTDPSAATNAGSLGCGDPSQFVPEFKTAIESLEVGERSDPIETEFGFHVIEVTEPSEDDLATAAAEARDGALREWVTESVAGSEVTVDERIGTWDAASGVIPVGTPEPPPIPEGDAGAGGDDPGPADAVGEPDEGGTAGDESADSAESDGAADDTATGESEEGDE